MTWKKWDSDNVNDNAAHTAINLHRQIDNVIDLSANRNRAYTLWFSDPLEVGSVGRPRGYYFRSKVVPETGTLKISVTYEVFDASVNTGFRLSGLSTQNLQTSLAVTNGRTVKEFFVDVEPAQRVRWDPRGIPIVMDVLSDPASGITQAYTLHADFTGDMFLAVSPDPNLDFANPLSVVKVTAFKNDKGDPAPAAASPTRQVIETIELPGLKTWGATVSDGGVDYALGQFLTLDEPGGLTVDRVPSFTVTGISGGGVVTEVELFLGGTYQTERPDNPVPTIEANSGPGAGCELNVLYDEGGFNVWPPLSENRDYLVADNEKVTNITTQLYGRLRVYSIHIEEIEQTGQYVTSRASALFPFREAYEVKKALQSGYALRHLPHMGPYTAQENLWANRTATHSCGPGPHGGSPSDSNYKSLLSVFPTQLWNSGTFGPRSLFGVFFSEGDHFFNAGVDLERASATIYADVMFFSQNEDSFTASYFAEMYGAPSTLLGSSPPEEVLVSPIPFSTNDYMTNIYNYFDNIEESSFGSRNNLQGLFEKDPFKKGNWPGLVRIKLNMKIPDVTVALGDYIEVIFNISEDDLKGDTKAVVLSWSVVEETGMAIEVLGRT